MISRLKTMLGRPGFRAAADNFGWLVADKFARFFLSVCVGFWVARYLGPERFGILNYAQAITGIMLMVVEGGLEGVVRRELLQNDRDAPSLLAAAGMLRLIAAMAAYSLLLLALAFGWGETGDRELLTVLGLLIFQPVLFVPELWFHAKLQSRVCASMQILALMAGAAARLVLVAVSAPLTAFAWVMVAEMCLAGGLLWWRGRVAGLTLVFMRRLSADARKLWRESWPLLLSGIAVAVYMRIDTVMLRRLAGEVAVGEYAAAARFTEIWFFIPGALAVSVLPSLLRARAAGGRAYVDRLDQYCQISVSSAYLLAVPTTFLAPWLIHLAYGAAYAASAPVLALHVWVLVFAFIGVVRGQYCINEGLTRFHLCATIMGAGLNIGLNLALIPRYGAQGAALATLMSQALAAWLSTFCIAATRDLAWMQTRALFFPFRVFRHV